MEKIKKTDTTDAVWDVKLTETFASIISALIQLLKCTIQKLTIA